MTNFFHKILNLPLRPSVKSLPLQWPHIAPFTPPPSPLLHFSHLIDTPHAAADCPPPSQFAFRKLGLPIHFLLSSVQPEITTFVQIWFTSGTMTFFFSNSSLRLFELNIGASRSDDEVRESWHEWPFFEVMVNS